MVFGIVILVAFQNVFYLEMNQNNVFIFKNLFSISAYQNDPETPKKLI